MNLVSRDHPVVELLESLHCHWQPLPKVMQRLMGDYQNGPGEMFDARYITMARCCLLGMKLRPQKWPLTEALKQKLTLEFQLASTCNLALEQAGVELSEKFHVFSDAQVNLQLTVGSVLILNGEPVTMIYRMSDILPDKPKRADVITAFCGAHLRSFGTGALVYVRLRMGDGLKLKVFHIKRDIETYEAVVSKLRHLQRRLLVGQAPDCSHES